MTTPTCSVRGCESPYRSRGLCRLHYNHALRGKIPMPGSWVVPKRQRPEQARCRVAGCGAATKYRSSALCRLHYDRMQRIGSVELPDMPSESERFWKRVIPTGFCWEWDGGHDSAGYGMFSMEPSPDRLHTTERIHIYAYKALIGEIPQGLQLDHLCRNRGCCNPDHLEPVTQAENIRRGQSVGARIARTGACDRGHPESMFYTRPDNGHRFCAACASDRRKQRREG